MEGAIQLSKVIIIPEPHLYDKSFTSRRNYPTEVKSYLDQTINFAKSLQASGEDVYLIFAGDVFHMGYSKMIPFVHIVDYFQTLSHEFNNQVYSLIGNHELSYPRSNPFWLLGKFDSKYYQSYSSIPGYQSIACLNVCDQLRVDNTLFVFGHYHRTDYEYDFSQYEDVQFITHNSIMDTEIINVLKSNFNRDPKMEYAKGITSIRQKGSIPFTEKLTGMYVGHMHTAYSTFFVDEQVNDTHLKFTLRYLGSLGRTNHLEVNDSDLVRSIYYVDTITHKVESFEINLLPRNQCIEEEIVEANHASYVRNKAIKQLRSDKTVFTSPVEGIRNWLSQSPLDLDLFNQLIQKEPVSELDVLLSEAGI